MLLRRQYNSEAVSKRQCCWYFRASGNITSATETVKGYIHSTIQYHSFKQTRTCCAVTARAINMPNPAMRRPLQPPRHPQTKPGPSRPCKYPVTPVSQRPLGVLTRLQEKLTPSLCANRLTTPFCGDRMTVSIFIDSMLEEAHVSTTSFHSSSRSKLTQRAARPSQPPAPRRLRSSGSCTAWAPRRCRRPP